MSAPLRYARILNGLPSLISRRSAISRRMRAMEELSMPLDAKPLALDRVVQNAGATRREGFRNRLARGGRPVAEETPAPARAANLGRRRARPPRARNQILDRCRRHSRRQTLAVVPLRGDLPADLVPVGEIERGAHRQRGVADALERFEDVAVAVDVALGDVPVVGA